MLADVALMFLRLYPNSLHNIPPFLAWKSRLENCEELCYLKSPVSVLVEPTARCQDAGAGLLAAAMIAVVPGYISRSVAGSYDNEGPQLSCTQMLPAR